MFLSTVAVSSIEMWSQTWKTPWVPFGNEVYIFMHITESHSERSSC